MLRILFLSLCLSSALSAAVIETTDPWAELRLAAPLPADPEPESLAVPNLPLELASLLQFVMAFAYPGLEGDEYDAVFAALAPQYESFLRGFATVPLSAVSAFASPIGLTPLASGALSLADPVGVAEVPEPGSWALLAGGMAALLAAYWRRGVALPCRETAKAQRR